MNNNKPFEHNSDPQLVLNRIVLDYMKEKRYRRVLSVIKTIIIAFLLLGAYYAFIKDDDSNKGKKAHVGLIDIKGTIVDSDSASAEYFAKGMARAYKKKGLKAVIVRINSGGGSPVQSDYMFNTITYYRKTFPAIKVYAVCTDICASGAYYLASAADAIYANESSMVGSIGVVYNGFGFVDTLQKLGITRRVQTAGNNKALLDPFSPMDAHAKAILQTMLDDVHQAFINKVRQGRGARLMIDADTFSGLVWTGKHALARGLIDGFASSAQLARDIIKTNVIIDYTYKQSVIDRMSRSIGAAVASSMPQALGLHSGIIA